MLIGVALSDILSCGSCGSKPDNASCSIMGYEKFPYGTKAIVHLPINIDDTIKLQFKNQDVYIHTIYYIMKFYISLMEVMMMPIETLFKVEVELASDKNDYFCCFHLKKCMYLW